MKKNQNGFSAVEGLLLLVIVGMLGFVGWYVYQAKNKTNNTYKSNTSQTSQPSTSTQNTPSIQDTVYSKVPADLQAAIVAETKKEGEACVKDGKIVNIDGKTIDQRVVYDTSGYAITPIGCGGGSAYLFAKSGGKWLVIDKTQFAFKCDLLKQYKVPVKLLEVENQGQGPAQCDGGETNTAPSTYKG